MTTLNNLIANLQKLQAEGHGDKQVFYCHGASGDCGKLGSAHVTDEVNDECGPFDLDDGEQYVSVYAGS